MNRRGFLRSIAGLAGAKALAPLAAVAALEPVSAGMVTLPPPSKYVIGIDVGEWDSNSRTLIMKVKARQIGITCYQLDVIHEGVFRKFPLTKF